MAACDTLGLPRDGRIAEVVLTHGSVEVTFLREPSDPDRKGDVLIGGPDSIAKVTVPIRVLRPQ